MIEILVDTNFQKIRGPDSLLSPVQYLNMNVHFKDAPHFYHIRNVTMTISPTKGLKDSIRFRADLLSPEMRDSINISSRKLGSFVPVTFISEKSHLNRINFNFLTQRIHLAEKSRYSMENDRTTQKRLQELGMMRYVLVRKEVIDSLHLIDVDIQTQMAPRYQIRVGTEGFTNDITTSNLPSIGSNIVFRNRNTFGGSEFLEGTLAGNLGSVSKCRYYQNSSGIFLGDQCQYKAELSQIPSPISGKKKF